MRVLPVVCAAATVGILTGWSAKRWGTAAALVAGSVLAANPLFALVSRNVRGYSLMVLGCTVAKINPSVPIIHLRFGEQLIDLIPGNGPAKSEKEGLEHFCLSVKCDDMPAAAVELRKKGVQVEQENPKFFGAYGDSPSFYVRDPDGYKVELKAR